MRIESPYCEHDGLNLTWESLEGLAKHNGPVTEPNWALAQLDAAWPLELGNMAIAGSAGGLDQRRHRL